jgi:hypothetical protein
MIQSKLPRWPDKEKAASMPHWEVTVPTDGELRELSHDFPMGVRPAQAGDTDEVFDLAIMAHKESGVGNMDEGIVREVVERGCRGDGIIFGIIEGPERIEAVIGLRPELRWYMKNIPENWHNQDILTYVHPLHRKSTHIMKLFRFAKWWGQETGLPVLIGLTLAGDSVRKQKLYSMFARQIGALYMLYGPESFPPRGMI